MASLKASLRRHAVKVAERRVRLDILDAELQRANVPLAAFPTPGGDHANPNAPDICEMGGGAIAALASDDPMDGGAAPCLGDADFINCGAALNHVYENPTGDAGQQNCDHEDNVDTEADSEAVQSSSASDSDDLSDVEGDGRPVFQDDREKEQYVIDTVREWAQEPGQLSMTKLDHLLHRLSMVFPRMPLTYTTLFACDYDFNIKHIGCGQVWFKGIKVNLDQLDLRDYLAKYSKVIIDVGIDGLPLKNFKLWPILAHLVGTTNPPFIIGVFKGDKDPDNVEEFLADYVAELQGLFRHGYEFEGRSYEFVVRNYVCDALARQFLKCIMPHTGYASCERCEVIGEHVSNRLVFEDLAATSRTDQSFNDRKQPRHHKGRSPLEDVGTGMVSQFRLDPMHLVYGGVVKRLLYFWLFIPGIWKLHYDLVDVISSVFEFLKPYCPSDFNRKPRSLKFFKSFKCTEFRRLILYDGILAFKDLLDENVYKHFLLLHCAIYIMCSKTLFAANREVANELIRTFVSHAAVIYGSMFVVYNVHSLIHLFDECIMGYTLDDISAFKFENALKSIKETLKSGLHPLQQLARRDQEKKTNVVTLFSKPTHVTLSLKHKVLNEVMDGQQYRKLKTGSLTLRLGKSNSCVKTHNGDIFVLQNIVCKHRKVYLIGCKFTKLVDFYEYPIPSSQLGIFQVSGLSKERVIFRLHDVLCKCYLMPDGQHFLCVPILHSYWSM